MARPRIDGFEMRRTEEMVKVVYMLLGKHIFFLNKHIASLLAVVTFGATGLHSILQPLIIRQIEECPCRLFHGLQGFFGDAMVDYLRSTYNSIKPVLITSIVLLLHILNIIRVICYTKQKWWTLTQLLIQSFITVGAGTAQDMTMWWLRPPTVCLNTTF